jgi:hypothetical protein
VSWWVAMAAAETETPELAGPWRSRDAAVAACARLNLRAPDAGEWAIRRVLSEMDTLERYEDRAAVRRAL